MILQHIVKVYQVVYLPTGITCFTISVAGPKNKEKAEKLTLLQEQKLARKVDFFIDFLYHLKYNLKRAILKLNIG